MVIGIDKGTTYTKTSNEKMFKSTIRLIEDEMPGDKDSLILSYNKRKYLIGEKGRYATDLMKSKSDDTLIFVLAAIASSISDRYIDVNLVTGLPVGLYTKQKESMKNIFHDTTHMLKVNNIEKRITIRNCEVFPEGVGAFYSTEHKDGLIIDVGGLSVDVALFENKKLIKHSTYSLGSMKLFRKIANKINSIYDTSLTEWSIESIITNGLYIDGQPQDIRVITKDCITDHTLGIMNALKLDYDVKTIKNVLMAGGCKTIQHKLQESIKHANIINNPQFANALGYKRIGSVLF